MKLLRWGAKRNTGISNLFEQKPSIYVSSNKIGLTVKNIQDKSSESTFNYSVEISFEDLLKILNEIDKSAFADEKDHKEIAEVFAKSTKTLFRLLMLSSGLSSIPKDDEETYQFYSRPNK